MSLKNETDTEDVEQISLQDLRAVLRDLEREGLLVSRVGPDGQILWRITEDGRRVADEMADVHLVGTSGEFDPKENT